MTARPFWMICRAPRHEHSKTEPRQRFASEDEAMQAAQAMADQQGADFVVLAATRTIRPRSDQESLL